MGCTYCYEEPDRELRGEDGETVVPDYDIDAIFERLEQWKEERTETPGLHGGEPLLMRDEDIEAIFRWIASNYDDGGHIQTNGTLITDKHVEIFQRYNVHVGISADGPPSLNTEREARMGGEDVTDRMSEKTMRAITRLRDAGVQVGVIVVLHQLNAGTEERLETLFNWIDNLNRMNVSGHFNPAIPYEDIQTDISLEPERLKDVYLATWEFIKQEPHRKWDPPRQYQKNLLGLELGNCVNATCDIANAGAAKIIKGNGETTGCGKTWSAYGDGTTFLQGNSNDSEYDSDPSRYEMLKQTPGWVTDGEPDMGGCKGCRYWNVCHGGCPSSGKDFDYRNRTRWCKAKYALYEKIEHDMRRMFPNIRLVTDLPWNAKISDLAQSDSLDIMPFGEMSPSISQTATIEGSKTLETVTSMTPDERLPERSWDEIVREYEEEHGAENVEADEETGHIHADSEQGWQKVD